MLATMKLICLRLSPDDVQQIDSLRFNVILRMLKSEHFNARMNALKEVVCPHIFVLCFFQLKQMVMYERLTDFLVSTFKSHLKTSLFPISFLYWQSTDICSWRILFLLKCPCNDSHCITVSSKLHYCVVLTNCVSGVHFRFKHIISCHFLWTVGSSSHLFYTSVLLFFQNNSDELLTGTVSAVSPGGDIFYRPVLMQRWYINLI